MQKKLTITIKESKAMADQLATVSKLRFFNHTGGFSEADMRKAQS